MIFPLLFIFVMTSYSVANQTHQFETAFEWTYINFTWPSEQLSKSLNYTPGIYIPVGIKIHDSSNRLFVALPRVKSAARITLASIPLNTNRKNPLLTPYPSWEMNMGSNCDTLQDVISMEIDREGIMWVADGRRISAGLECPSKIILFDLNNKDRIVRKYDVPDELCPRDNGCYLNDIVVDGDFAYFSDTTKSDPGILVYNRVLNQSWKIRDNKTMWGDLEASNFIAQGVPFSGVSHINGIALSPSCPSSKYFYYTPQTSFHVYSIPTSILKNKQHTSKNASAEIQDVILKSGATGGMVGDSTGDIYLGILPEDSVVIASPDKGSVEVVYKNSETIKWPDTFAFDLKGNLWVSATQILRFTNRELNLSEVNFRILKIYTGKRSYFYCDRNLETCS